MWPFYFLFFFYLKKNARRHKLLDYVLILEEVMINKIKRMSRMKKNEGKEERSFAMIFSFSSAILGASSLNI